MQFLFKLFIRPCKFVFHESNTNVRYTILDETEKKKEKHTVTFMNIHFFHTEEKIFEFLPPRTGVRLKIQVILFSSHETSLPGAFPGDSIMNR